MHERGGSGVGVPVNRIAVSHGCITPSLDGACLSSHLHRSASLTSVEAAESEWDLSGPCELTAPEYHDGEEELLMVNKS